MIATPSQTPLTNPAAPDPTTPKTPTAPTPTPLPTATLPVAGPSQTPLTNPAATAPTTLPVASPTPPTGGGGGAGTPAGYTYDAAAQGWNVPAGQVTAGAANNPIGNAAFQWVVDPVTGAFAKKGTENTVDASGMAFDASGKPMDLPGSTHTYTYDQQQGTPVQESFQRAGINGATSPAMSGDGHGGGLPVASAGSPLPTGGEVQYSDDGGHTPNAAWEAARAAQEAAHPGSTSAAAGGQSLSGYVNGSADAAPTGALPLAPSSTTGPGGVSLSNTDLTGSTISAGPTANRQQLVQDQIQNYAKGLLPNLQAQIRAKTQQAAGMGRIGSGMLRTDVGNLDRAAENDLGQKFSDLTTGATSGSIGDAQEAARLATQQQGFQAGQQQTAFNQGTQQIALQEALTSGDFNRYMQLLNAGNTGNPSDTALALSNSYGTQAGQAGQAVGNLIGSSVANQNSGLPPWLQAYLKGQPGSSPVAPGGALPVGGDGGGQS